MSITQGPATGGLYPEPLRELIARVDLCSVVEQHAGPGRRAGKVVEYRCPLPGHDDNTPSFQVGVNKYGKQVCGCRSQCGYVGDLLDFLRKVEGLDNAGAIRRARQLSRTEWRPSPTPASTTAPKRTAKPAHTAAPVDTSTRYADMTSAEQDHARRVLASYLEWRRWPEWVVEAFGLEPVLDRFGFYRVRHPFLVEDQGKVSAPYWQDRAQTPHAKLRWVGPEGGAPVPYNLPSLGNGARPLEWVLICEGPADTISAAVALAGLEGFACVGVPGVQTWRTEWARHFAGHSVMVCPDLDQAGHSFALAVGDTLGEDTATFQTLWGDLSEHLRREGPDSLRRALEHAVHRARQIPGIAVTYSPEDLAGGAA